MTTFEVVPDALDRPHLIALLEQRWDRRVVLVVAGAGFGKSTVIAQALAHRAANRSDHAVRLDARCATASVLIERLAGSVGLPDAPSLDRIVRHIEAGDGEHCIVLDDLHTVADDSEGMDQVRALVRTLPANAHLVVAARVPPRLPLARARAARQVLDIGENDLAFTADELAEIARRHDVSGGWIADTGGWPALVSLTLQAGKRGAVDYLIEEVLDGLDPELSDLLTCAVLAEGASPRLLRAMTGFRGDVYDVAARLPLVAIDHADTLRPHAMWTDAVHRRLAEDERRRLLIRIAEHRRAAGDLRGAIACATRAGGIAVLSEVVRDIGRLGHVALNIDEIDAWIDAAGGEFLATSEGRLLAALSQRAHEPFADRTKDALAECWREFRELDIVGCEMIAMSELGFVLRSRGEIEELRDIIDRFRELEAAGHQEARALASFSRSVLAEQSGDVAAALAEFESIRHGQLSDGWTSLVESQRCRCLLLLGRPREAVEAARRSAELASPGSIGGWASHLIASWYTGVERDLLDRLPTADTLDSPTLVDLVWIGAWFGALQAMCGRLDEAARNIGVAEAAMRPETQPELVAFVAWAHIVDAASDGDPERARRLLDEFSAAFPIGEPLWVRMVSRFPAIAWLLSDDTTRVLLEDRLGGPWQTTALDAAALLDGLRTGQADREWPIPSEVLTALPLPWALELAAHGRRAGRPEADGLLAHLERTVGSDAVARARRHLPDGIGLDPVGERRVAVDVRLLGDTQIEPRDRMTGLDELRRRRVRELLALVALEGPISRDRLGVVLWPDLDQQKMSSNLRSNLAYLRKIRTPAGEPIVVETAAGWALGDDVTVDVQRFELLTRDAAEALRAGAAGAALDLFDRALELVRGRPLVDAGTDAWFGRTAERLTVAVTEAATQAADLALSADHHAAARRLAELALSFDEYHEAAHRARIRALVALGDRAATAAATRTLRQMLDDLGVAPEAATDALLADA